MVGTMVGTLGKWSGPSGWGVRNDSAAGGAEEAATIPTVSTWPLSGGSYTQQPNLVVLSGPKGKCRWSLSKCYLGSATKVLFKTDWLVICLLWLKLEGPLMFHSCFFAVATLTLEKTMGQNCVVKTIKKIQQDVWQSVSDNFGLC
jgi:hypothetical protein